MDGYRGEGADIAILDTDVDSDHSDLDNVGYSRGFGYRTWEDGNGSHCAGIAAAENDGQGIKGVAPDATLHAGKVLSDSGSARSPTSRLASSTSPTRVGMSPA